MPKATRYACSQCGNSFTLEFFLQQNQQLCCLFCNSQSTALAEIKELKSEVAQLKEELQLVRKLAQDSKAVEESRTNQTNARNKESSDDGFISVQRGRKNNANRAVESATITLENRFAVLQEEEEESEPDVMLVGDSLVRGQGDEFCRNKPRRKFRCYPGQKIEDITERVDYLVDNSKEDTLFLTLVGTNNLHRDNSTDIVDKYRVMIKKFAARRRKVAVCSIIPRYDADIAMFRKMSVVNRQVQALCRQEDMHFFDLWHHFSRDKTLYARDGLHLNCVGKARLGRVIGESLRDISHSPEKGNGSPLDRGADRIDRREEIDDVNVKDRTAPVISDVRDIHNVVRQEDESGPSGVPCTEVEISDDEDFQ